VKGGNFINLDMCFIFPEAFRNPEPILFNYSQTGAKYFENSSETDFLAVRTGVLYNKVPQWSAPSTKRYTNHEIKISLISACLLPPHIDAGGANL
jgi:hypothetical protein